MPVIPDQNTVYFVADPLNPGLCDAFVSGNLGNVRKIKGDVSMGGASYVQTVTATEAIGGNRAVTAAGLYPVEATLDLILGVTLGAAVSGALVEYVGSGPMTETGWAWTPGAPIYAGPLGVLTQIEPLGTFRRIATAVSPTKITVDLQPTIHRS